MISRGKCMDIRSLAKQGYSQRQIARELGLHRSTVRKYLEREGLPVYRAPERESMLAPYYPLIDGWLEEQDYRATRIYDLVKLEGFGGSYDIVRRYVRQVKEKRDRIAYVRFETMPAQQAQVDFGEFLVREPDGSWKKIFCFVIVLGYSRHVYAEFVQECTMTVFLACHQNAWGFFRGVPAEVLYDNMKNVVSRSRPVPGEPGRLEWNGRFAGFCAHYGFRPLAAPGYSAWVKGKVERPIDFVRGRFWQGYRYQGLERANGDLQRWLLGPAFEREHGTTREKVADRFFREQPQLGALPRQPFDLAERFWRPVHKDCQIAFGANRYVVPHRCVGRKVLLKVYDGVMRIYDDQELLVVYRIPAGKGQLVQDPRFYRQLRADREQLRRKYRRPAGKGWATRGLVADRSDGQVMQRSLAEYERLAGETACPS